MINDCENLFKNFYLIVWIVLYNRCQQFRLTSLL